MYIEFGAITFLDSDEIKENDIVDFTILTNNIQKIYKTTKTLANKFNIADFYNIEKEALKLLEEKSQSIEGEKKVATSDSSQIEFEEGQRIKY